MEILVLAILTLSLILSGAAYYRSGRKQATAALEQRLNQKIERLGLATRRAADRRGGER
jgi:hypothetical protein